MPTSATSRAAPEKNFECMDMLLDYVWFQSAIGDLGPTSGCWRHHAVDVEARNGVRRRGSTAPNAEQYVEWSCRGSGVGFADDRIASNVEGRLGELRDEEDQTDVPIFIGGLDRRGGMAVEARTLALVGIGRGFRRRLRATVALVDAVGTLVGAVRTDDSGTAVFGSGRWRRGALERAKGCRYAAPALRERKGEAANQGQQSCGDRSHHFDHIPATPNQQVQYAAPRANA